MKFSEIKIINDAKNISYSYFDNIIKTGILLYIDSEAVIRVLDVKKFDLIFQKRLNYIPFIQFCSGRIYLRHPEDTLYYLNYQNGSINLFYKALSEKDFEISVGLVSGNIVLETKSKYENYSLIESHSKLIDIESNCDLYFWNTMQDLVFLDGSIAYFQPRSGGEIICKDIIRNKHIWSIFCDNGTQWKRIFGKFESKLYLQRVDTISGLYSVICLNETNGTKEWEIGNSLSYYYLDDFNGRILGLGDEIFEIINVETGEREMQKKLDLQVPAHLTYYADGYLYFSGYKGDNVTRIFGAVDVNTGALAFTQSIEMPNGENPSGCYDRPVVVDNRLYIRDQLKTLHVYEMNY
jgi:outer membrane protein assembly factor BamB